MKSSTLRQNSISDRQYIFHGLAIAAVAKPFADPPTSTAVRGATDHDLDFQGCFCYHCTPVIGSMVTVIRRSLSTTI